MQIYLARNQVQAGPYTLEQLNKMLATHQVELNDLMWHEGMSEWKRVGDLTNETHHYDPKGADSRLTVAELYGNNPTQNTADKQAEKMPFTVNKTYEAPKPTLAKTTKTSKNELAHVLQRIIAVIIDQLLGLACLIPIFTSIDFSMANLEKIAQNDTQTVMQLFDAVPQHLLSMFLIMVLALLVVQLFMLVRRGQTIGKLVMGVRILDIQTNKIPSITNIVLLRTIVTNLAYSLSTIGMFIAFADLIMMLVDKQNRALHDKIAKTYVMKAQPHQLEKK